MENYLGIQFDRKTQLVAMAAVSGLALSTALAAKAGSVPSSPNIAQAIANNENKHIERYNELESKYQSLLAKHNTMISDSILSGTEMLSLEEQQERSNEGPAQEKEYADAALAKCLAQIQSFEIQQREAEDLVSNAVGKISRLEEELSAAAQEHIRKSTWLEEKITQLQSDSDTRATQLDALQVDLHSASVAKQVLESSLSEAMDGSKSSLLELEKVQAREKDLLKRHQDSAAVFERQINDHRNSLTSQQSRIDSLVAQNTELAHQLNSREQEMQSNVTEKNSSREALTQQRADHERLQIELSNAAQDLAYLKENYDSQIKKLQQESQGMRHKHEVASQETESSLTIYKSELKNLKDVVAELTQENDDARTSLSAAQSTSKKIEEEHQTAMRGLQRTVKELTRELEQATAATQRIERQILDEHADLMHAKSQEMSQAEDAHKNYVQELNGLHDYELHLLKSETQNLRFRLNQLEDNNRELRSIKQRKSEHKNDVAQPTKNVPASTTDELRAGSTGSASSEAFEQSNTEINSLDIQERSLARFRASEIFDSQRDSRSTRATRAGSTSQRTVSNDRQSMSQSEFSENANPGKQLGRAIGDDGKVYNGSKIPRTAAHDQAGQTQYIESSAEKRNQQRQISLSSNPPSSASRQRSASGAMRLTPLQTDTRIDQSSRFMEGSPTSTTSTSTKERGFRGLFRRASGKFKSSPESSGKSVTGRSTKADYPTISSPIPAPK
ncbi:Predicted protein [Taphrina deformans PYCC 5710]|uniref:Uncharacterized protein n=1 Tax=Taphrina deformans (strain PYCC 5710 / ATCC 11124 / CBS 356.35 / IMI 108563 / JCM 9778 / NBRC 8474) TaxID=1097556 RepID=R4X9L3_TAPDE|nr:Predicted protein [Taphrina deformans PYCC 5710]|eukprot:CCG80924.1 Predicted protein [Taphrina deformans PYCC 5710]